MKYYEDEWVTLYCGDFREILPDLGVQADLLMADPPYNETSLAWDKWPTGWLVAVVLRVAPHVPRPVSRVRRLEALSGRRVGEAQRVRIRPRPVPPSPRIRRPLVPRPVGRHLPPDPTTPTAVKKSRRSKLQPTHTGVIDATPYTTEAGDPLLMTSVIYARSMHGRAINETEKPTEILAPLIEYGCPPGGLVIDPFAGSSSTLVTARSLGRRAIGIELREEQCEKAVRHRLAQDSLFGAAS